MGNQQGQAPAATTKLFGKVFCFQETFTADQSEALAKTVENWEKAGHTLLKKKDKADETITHLYASQAKTRDH